MVEEQQTLIKGSTSPRCFPRGPLQAHSKATNPLTPSAAPPTLWVCPMGGVPQGHLHGCLFNEIQIPSRWRWGHSSFVEATPCPAVQLTSNRVTSPGSLWNAR